MRTFIVSCRLIVANAKRTLLMILPFSLSRSIFLLKAGFISGSEYPCESADLQNGPLGKTRRSNTVSTRVASVYKFSLAYLKWQARERPSIFWVAGTKRYSGSCHQSTFAILKLHSLGVFANAISGSQYCKEEEIQSASLLCLTSNT